VSAEHPEERSLSELSLDEAARLTSGAQMWATAALPGAGVPAMHMADGPMGMASIRVDERDVALLMPCGTALAASWDLDLARRVGALVGSECTRLGRQAVLGPNLNLPRSPLAGRAFETYSEDPLLSAELGAVWIQGVQAGGVSAVAKHVVGNDSETQRHRMNSVMDERTLREVYLRPFERAAQVGVGGMLMAYNRLNGVPCAEQAEVIGVLRGELGWRGVLMSDWFGVQDGARSLRAGLDLEMPGPGRQMGAGAAALVEAGEVEAGRVEQAARSVATWAARWQTPAPAVQDARELLIEAAAASFVLLDNRRGVLPLDPMRPLAVLGPNAGSPCYQGATFARIALSDEVQTPLAALRRVFAQVEHEVGVAPEYRLPPLPHLPIVSETGEPGLTVTYHPGGPDAPATFSEVRRTSTLVWFAQDMPAGLSTHERATVRASTTLTPESDGLYTLQYGGTGDVTLRVNGEAVGTQPSPVVGGDVMGHLLRGEALQFVQPLKAGGPVRLEYEMTYAPARAQGLWFGARPPAEPDLPERAAALAARTPQAVLVVGETADSGVESRDRTTTRLPQAQLDLIGRVCAANPQTVVVVNAAHAVDLSWAPQAAAVLQVWFPGQGFGEALAEVLAGTREPGGRLPVTFARQEDDYPAFDLTPDARSDLYYREGPLIGYRSLAARGVTPAYPLGHGFGYAAFEYGEVHVIPEGDGVEIRVGVTNTSARAGKAVVQAYLEQPAFEGVPAHPELAAFAALTLAAGERGVARLTVLPEALRRWSQATGGWVRPKEARALKLGASLTDVFWSGTLPE